MILHCDSFECSIFQSNEDHTHEAHQSRIPQTIKRNGWYDHYCDHCPCTNNSLESTNRYVKDDGTLRQRLGIKQFLSVLENGFVKRWSTDRKPTVLIKLDDRLEQENVNLKKFNRFKKFYFFKLSF